LIGKLNLMVLDEPTSGLDPVSAEIFMILDELAGKAQPSSFKPHQPKSKPEPTDCNSQSGKLVANDPWLARRRAALPISCFARVDTVDEAAVAQKQIMAPA
jgi:hypothetical protein